MAPSMKTFSDLLFIAAAVMAFQELAAERLIAEEIFLTATMFLPLLLGWSYKANSDGTLVSGSRIAELIREGLAIATLTIYVALLQKQLAPAFVSAVVGSWSLYVVGRVFGRSIWLLIGVSIVVAALYLN